MSIGSNSVVFSPEVRRLDDFDHRLNGELGQFKVTCSEVDRSGDVTYGCEHPDERSKLDRFKSWINHTFLNKMEDRDTFKRLASYDMGDLIRQDVGDRFSHLSSNLKDDLTNHIITNGTLGKMTYDKSEVSDRPRIHHHTPFGHAFNHEDLSRINDMMDKYVKTGVPYSMLQTSEARQADLMQRDPSNQLSPAYLASMNSAYKTVVNAPPALTTHAKHTQV